MSHASPTTNNDMQEAVIQPRRPNEARKRSGVVLHAVVRARIVAAWKRRVRRPELDHLCQRVYLHGRNITGIIVGIGQGYPLKFTIQLHGHNKTTSYPQDECEVL